MLTNDQKKEVAQLSDKEIIYLKYKLDKENSDRENRRWWLTVVTIFIPIVIAGIGIWNDILTENRQAENALRLEIVKDVLDLETFQGVRERILLANFVADEEVIPFDNEEFQTLVEELIQLRDDDPPEIPGLAILFTGASFDTCNELNPEDYNFDKGSLLNRYGNQGDEWTNAVLASEQFFESDPDSLTGDVLAGIYIAYCSEVIQNGS